MASGVNLKEKSGVGIPEAVCRCTQPHSGNSCDVVGAKLRWSCCSFGSITDVEGGGGGGGAGEGMLHGQQPVPHITLPRLTSIKSPNLLPRLERTLQLHYTRGHSKGSNRYRL